MRRPLVQGLVIALVALFIGVAGSAAVLAYIPDPGSAPSIYDDFKWSSTANGFWHVNPIGATATIKNGLLTLSGHLIELDHRVQTDPDATIVVAKVRGLSFHKFGLGLGVYHSGTLGLEFDDDGIKCGRGTDYGWRVDFVKPWKMPPVGQWFILKAKIVNPYPTAAAWNKVSHLDADKLKPVTLTCSVYDAQGHLLASVTPTDPEPNAHYIALDEAFMRTWDSRNKYQVDWYYAGPPTSVLGSSVFG
jgi:hypothetical protein